MQYVDNIKYLGVILSNNIKDDLYISRQLRCLYVSVNIILRRFASSNKVFLVVKSYCNLYCSLLWSDFTKRHLYKLEVAYNNVFSEIACF